MVNGKLKLLKKKKAVPVILELCRGFVVILAVGVFGDFLCWFFSCFFSPLVAKHVSSCPVVKPFLFFSILPRV